MRRFWTVVWLCGLAWTSGCAASSGDRLRANAEAVAHERTPGVLRARGDAFAAAGDSERAEQYLLAAIASGGDEHVLVRRIIQVCVADRRLRAARAYADDSLRRHPDEEDMRFVRATLDAALGATETAKQDLQALVRSSPENPTYRFALAVLLRDGLGQDDAAREHFAKALELSPTGPEAEQARAGARGAEAP